MLAGSKSSTSPSDPGALERSSSDEEGEFSSVSLRRKNSSSDDESKGDKSKDSPESARPVVTSSQAFVSSMLPPAAVALSSSPKANTAKPAVVAPVLPNRDQAPAVTATKPPQKGLLAKLGFKSASQQQQLPATATPGVAPAATQQKAFH